ncbi:MAG: hypothetical protein AB2A00_42440, partial [Myxococcota bacterium]
TAAGALMAVTGLAERPWEHPEALGDAGLGDLADVLQVPWPLDASAETWRQLGVLDQATTQPFTGGGLA